MAVCWCSLFRVSLICQQEIVLGISALSHVTQSIFSFYFSHKNVFHLDANSYFSELYCMKHQCLFCSGWCMVWELGLAGGVTCVGWWGSKWKDEMGEEGMGQQKKVTRWEEKQLENILIDNGLGR